MIASVVASTFTDWELLIVDDGSTEDIKAVVESFNDKRIQFFRFDENKGIPHGSNFLLAKARGEFVCLLAADEWIWDKKLEVQVKYLDENPGRSIASGACLGATTRLRSRARWGRVPSGRCTPASAQPLARGMDSHHDQLRGDSGRRLRLHDA
jgi:glycosyltransferase involved in cell wall biosynthesis